MDYLTPLQNLLNKTSKHPDKVFLHQPINRKWRLFTWAEVELQARCIASGIKAQGYETGARIGILSKNCAEWFIADLAIMMAGMISVPIYTTAGRSSISYIIKHGDLKAIFVGKLDNTQYADESIGDEILRVALPYPTITAQAQWNDWLTEFPPLQDIHMPDIDDVLTIVYTSGTTGAPKGVVVSHKNFAAAVQNTATLLELKETDRSLSYLPLAHVTERSLVEAESLYVGNEVFFVESLDTFVDDLKHCKPTFFLSVPRLWSKFQSEILVKIPQKKLNTLLKLPLIGKLVAYKIRSALGLQHARGFGSGTAPISVSILEWYHRLGISISEAWGMSETSGLSCANFPFVKEHLGTIGFPADCIEMKLSEEKEILIRGDAVFKEYYLDPKLTNESFTDGWLHTGDCAQINSEGVYQIIGRIKEQFKTAKGKYVAPVPIESLLGVNHDLEQVCVMGSGLKQPIAIVVLAEGRQRKNSQLIKELEDTLKLVNDQLENHLKLDYLLVCTEHWTIENKLLTPTMKLKRNEIEKQYEPLLEQEQKNKILWEEDLLQLDH